MIDDACGNDGNDSMGLCGVMNGWMDVILRRRAGFSDAQSALLEVRGSMEEHLHAWLMWPKEMRYGRIHGHRAVSIYLPSSKEFWTSGMHLLLSFLMYSVAKCSSQGALVVYSTA
jgi:hypothetical protein